MPKKVTRSDLALSLRYRYQRLRARGRGDFVVRCDTPLVLISQVQRSGGTLLSQLFDDHPELFVHPHELHWGAPRKWDWPDFQDVSAQRPEYFWGALYNSFIDNAVTSGYGKGQFAHGMPFVFDRLRQWKTFRDAIRAGVSTQRDVFDCYMTSFFNCWTDYQNLYRGPKKYTVAFTPRVSMFPEYVDRFFRDYPDGYMISILRDPLSWFASAKKHTRGYRDMRDKSLDNLMGFWRQSTESLIGNRDRHGSRYLVIRFSDLVGRTEETIRVISRHMGIDFDSRLLTPTFNGIPILSNSSHRKLKETTGVITSTLSAYRDVLSEEEIARLEADFSPLFERAAAVALSPEGAPAPAAAEDDAGTTKPPRAGATVRP